MAARDRWGVPEPATSQLQRYIQSACDPVNYEPNLALCLEISDLINQKKGNSPREAAVAIVSNINSRNPNVSLLALALLDICVKNCGYPFHLQISTKDFLNELVRRFPEKPPLRLSRVQMKILEAIEEWKSTICQTSRYKEDLGFIRDMHRLLLYKGYMFPEVRREDAAVLNPTDNLKSAEELEEEERAAQSAKLQELIRRGTPADLQEANQLMKVMAGYDQSTRTDYRQKAAEEIAKLQEKQKLLDEMLAKVKQGETIGQQDAFEELSNTLRNAQPKLHKMAEEESDDAEAVVRLLALNDSINVTIEKYKLVKKGDLAAAANLKHTDVPDVASSSKAGGSSSVQNDLIDLMGDEIGGSSNGNAPEQKTASLEDDLLGLSFNSMPYGTGGGIALGFGANSSIPGPPLLSSTIQSNTARGPTPEPNAPSSSDPFAAFSGSNSARSNPNSLFNLQMQKQVATPSPPPQQQHFQSPPPPPPPQQQQQQQQRQQPQSFDNDDDFADFSSAVPPSSELPPLKATEIRLLANKLRVVLDFDHRIPGSQDVTLRAKFSSGWNEPIKDVTFQLAVPKSLKLQMDQQTSTTLQPNQQDGITQRIRISGVAPGAGDKLRLRWKVTFRPGENGPLEEYNDTISNVPVA